MSLDPWSSIRATLRLFRPAVVLQQAGVGVLTFLLSLVWLRLSDANVLWLLLTVVLGLAIAVGFGVGEASLLLRLAGQPRTRARLARGALLVLVVVLLSYAALALVGPLQANDGLRAGYLNSRFGPGARRVFTYQHLLQWFGWGWELLELLLQGVVGAVLLAPIVAVARAGAATLRCLQSLAYWIAVVLLFVFAPYVSGRLMTWVPGHGLGVETLSLVMRAVVIVAVDGTCAALLLCAVAASAQDGEAQPATAARTPAGTPFVSQPRTAPMP